MYKILSVRISHTTNMIIRISFVLLSIPWFYDYKSSIIMFIVFYFILCFILVLLFSFLLLVQA